MKRSTQSKPAKRSKKSKGIFITFEGGEGTGKTTQIALLAKAFEKMGKTVVVTREPGGSTIANRIRSLLLDPSMKGLVPLAELFLYEASRAQHVKEIIEPAIAAGHIVICDRFADSSIVYQGAARGLPGKLVHQLNQIATAGLSPHFTFLLDLDPRIGLARIGARGVLDRMEKENLSFHKAVRAGYLRLAKENKKRFHVISSTLSRDKIHESILGALRLL